MKSKKQILNVAVDEMSYETLLNRVTDSIERKERLVINYANANTIRTAGKNKIFAESISDADILYADGTGIWLASQFIKSNQLNKRFNFTDYTFLFIEDCIKYNWSIFLLGGEDRMLEIAGMKLRSNYPSLKIAGVLNGFNDMHDKNPVEIINNAEPDILWVGLGTPKQEIWISENVEKLNCRVIQSVGDLITHLAGKKARGPLFIRKMGLEWLARLIRHPVRYFDRYVIGIPRFIYLVIKTRDK